MVSWLYHGDFGGLIMFGIVKRDMFNSPFEGIMDEFFNDFFKDFSPVKVKQIAGSKKYPKVNVYKDGDDIKIKAFIPEIKKEDLKVVLNDTLLTISGRSEATEDINRGDYYIKEVANSYFSRSFTVPKENEGITADLKDGLLFVTIKGALKESEAEEKKEIEITVN